MPIKTTARKGIPFCSGFSCHVDGRLTGLGRRQVFRSEADLEGAGHSRAEEAVSSGQDRVSRGSHPGIDIVVVPPGDSGRRSLFPARFELSAPTVRSLLRWSQ
jgi:hypothetical protein